MKAAAPIITNSNIIDGTFHFANFYNGSQK